jgi:hypothetical protein
MKRWYISIASKVFTCSLLSMDAKTKTIVVKSDDDRNIIVMFNEFFDFARAKSGEVMIARAKWQHGRYKKSCIINFR